MKIRLLNRIKNRSLNKIKKRLKMFTTQESLANNMLMYLYMDSNYLDIPEYESGSFSIYSNMEKGRQLVEDYAYLN